MTLPAYTGFDVDKFLSDALRTVTAPSSWVPACNAYEDEHGLWLQCALPGMDRNDIELLVEDGVLTIRGEHRQDDAARTYLSREINWGPFARSFRVPENVDIHKIVAHYKDGMLTVELPKREEAKPRRITVE